MSPLSRKLAELLVAGRWPLLLLALALVVVAWPASRKLQFDRSIENMFAADDPLLPPYRQLKARFGGNEMALVVYRDPQLLAADGSGLVRLAAATERLKQVAGVQDVLSLSEVDRAMQGALKLKRAKDNLTDRFKGLLGLGGGRKKPAEEPPWTIVAEGDPLAQAFRQLFAGYTHDADGQIAAAVCMLLPEAETQTPRQQTIDQLRSVAQSLPQGMVTGEPVMVVDGFRYLEQDGQRLGRTSLVLLALTIVVCFRSIRWVLIPLAVVQWSLVMTQAVLVWMQLRLSMVSSMFTATITVVGVATVVHVIVRFRQARGRGLEPADAMRESLALLAAPICWACLTDAVGFASLMVARVGPVRDFGIMMATGSTLVLVAVALLVPGLALLGRFDTDPHRAWGERQLAGLLERLVLWVDKRPATLAGCLLLLLAISLAGLGRLQVETDFTRNFRQDSPIVEAYSFVEQQLGGAGVWDIIVPSPARMSDEYLRRIENLQSRLRALREADLAGGAGREPVDGVASAAERAALTKVISLADAVRVVEVEPSMASEPVGQRVLGMALSMPNFINSLRSRPDAEGRSYLRIMLRARERQPAEQKLELIRQVRELVEREFPAGERLTTAVTSPAGGQPDAGPLSEGGQVTGFFVLLANLVHSMIRDQWVCFAVATTAIGLMMLAALRSPLLALVALIPNALPIFVVLGGLGWLGLKINMGAAMIAAVSIGLSIDSSIHYIISFQRERRAGKPLYVALADVQQTVGRAVVFSTLALIVGFTVLCTSNFVPTIYFGALVSISMLGGLLGNLFVLPLLLRLVETKGRG
ncbi:MAG: MMPL family transporter [Pirellulaceae bacterium]|nr:MMPL family transporter [Pirellulaceae bacterium]